MEQLDSSIPNQVEDRRSRRYQGRGRTQRQAARERGRTDPGHASPTRIGERAASNAHRDIPANSSRRNRHSTRSDQHPDEPASSSTAPSTGAGTAAPSTPPARTPRRAKFKAALTEPVDAQTFAAPQHDPAPVEKHKPRPRRMREPPGDDLTSTLTHALRTPPFPDCPVCFGPIRPEHPTWSCSPPTSNEASALSTDGDKGTESSCCWNTFHLKCIRSWAEKSVKELEEAWRARGELRPGEWHCPGCRATRQAVPQAYMCFCLRMRHPAPPRIATPHSCAQPCSRQRSGCRHACPLPCHPGPCPPCAVTIQAPCFCGGEKRSAKCQLGMTALSFSCTQPCRKPLPCGNSGHLCAQICHEGPCPPCPRQEDVRCWCGQQTKRVACGALRTEDSTICVIVQDDSSEKIWTGSYSCGRPCERLFGCSCHTCSKICHPPSPVPPPCPFDPERVVSCACGRCRIARSSDEFAADNARGSSAPLLPPRTSCTSPLPTCTSMCAKPLPCGHSCQATCHWDPCPPCTEQVERTCRCGATKHKTPCSDSILVVPPTSSTPSSDDVTYASEAILCDKPCQAFRSCGRHQCGRICCPLASLQRIAVKASKRRDGSHADLDAQIQLQLDPTVRALHDCGLPCGRVLACGNHRCSQRDHKGPCEVCPRGVFEELACPCGRTILEPPIQCGTRLRCVYPCTRPAPECGHPHVQHSCHEGTVIAGADTADEGLGLVTGEGGKNDRACPPCPFLTEKVCVCGKKRVGNVRCSQEKVNCGSMCGKLLSCGFHHCERLCHADACGPCTAVCGKPRKSCQPEQHPCTQTCHAPAACPETEPCLAPVTLTCPCGHLRSTIPCSGTKLTLACTGECEIKKRNARLAEALGISEEKRNAKECVTWSAELVGIAKGLGPKFVGVVEKAFANFITSDRRTQVLPHMPPERRKFVHDVASVYRMDTVMVDQEPHRSVQLIRRIDSRVPTPLLSQYVTSTGSEVRMGRLIDSRTVAGKGVAGAGSSPWGSASGGSSVVAGIGTRTGASGSHSADAGARRWNMVAKSALEGARSGSTTPARASSPAQEAMRPREVSAGPRLLSESDALPSGTGTGTGTGTSVRTSGATTGPGVWVSPSVRAQRARDSATATVETRDAGSVGDVSTQDVPDDWEDDG